MSTIDIARAVARLQGRCPGIPLDGGGYSGCEGGDDCPVCLGKPVVDGAEVDELYLTVDHIMTSLRAEAVRLGERYAAARVAEAERVILVAERQVEAAQAERDELRAENGRLRAVLIASECLTCDGSGQIAVRGHERCARCDGSGRVVQTDVERLVAQVNTLTLERDALRAELERLQGVGNAIRLAKLRAAARELIAAIEAPEGDFPLFCSCCGKLALTSTPDGKDRCGDHANGGADLSYAPAWRRLVALAQEGT